METEKYMGHPMNYWIELEKQAQKLNVMDFIQEIADLRARLSFYDSRLNQIQNLRDKYPIL